MAYRSVEDRRAYHRAYEYTDKRAAYMERYRAENRVVKKHKQEASETASAKVCGMDVGPWRYQRNQARKDAKALGVTALSLYIERNLLSRMERKKLEK